MVITKTIDVPAEAADAIRALNWADDGRSAQLVGQLDRKAYTAVNKVLEAAGGKWNRKAGAHTFPAGARDALMAAVDDGGLTVELDGYFPTPTAVIDEMMRYWPSNLMAGEDRWILEPSAGEGAIAKVLRQAYPLAEMMCIERNRGRCLTLREQGFAPLEDDFLTVEPSADFDLVVMNPPFERQQDIDHITHAAEFLRTGGTLVSVASASVSFRDNQKTAEFRNLVDDWDGEIVPLPAGSFAESGTGVNTVLVVLRA